jgi:hypothetical protein
MRSEMVMLAFLLSIAARVAPSARLGLLCLSLASYVYARSFGCKFVVFDLPIGVASAALCIYVALSNRRPMISESFSKFLHYLIPFLMLAYGFLEVSGSAFSDALLGILILAVGFYLMGTILVMASISRDRSETT